MTAHRIHGFIVAALALLTGFLAPLSSAQAWTLKTLHSFCVGSDCEDGSDPDNAKLLLDKRGNLFGTTLDKFEHPGVVYELQRRKDDTWTYKVLKRFCSQEGCQDGEWPFGGLIGDINGQLYGTTCEGGDAGHGTFFSLTPQTDGDWVHTVLFNFPDANYCPNGGLAYLGDDKGKAYDGVSPLFGVSQGYSGTVWELTQSGGTWSFTQLHSFNRSDGRLPYSKVIVSASGALYGTTYVGGAEDLGVAYKLAQSGGAWSETVLHDFCSTQYCRDGKYLPGALAFDSDGNLFGLTGDGGAWCHLNEKGKLKHCYGGTVFKLSGADGNWRFDSLYSFCKQKPCPDGLAPYAGPILDGSGYLYATTQAGGAHLGGAVVRVAPDTGQLAVLYDFCALENCADGKEPQNTPIIGPDGTLYGTTISGGANGGGIVFQLSP